MSFDKSTNTITLNEDSDFLVDSGVFFIHTLKKLSLSESATNDRSKDWKIIENWLGCLDGNITSIEEEKIGLGWKAYLALGLAPSFKLQETFNHYSKQYKDSGYSYKKDKPPTEVMDVFDRLLATDEEIKVKQYHDLTEDKKKLDAVLKSLPKKQLTLKQKLFTFSKRSRVLISIFIAWLLWVVFRTSGDWEILGIYLIDWDEDMFFLNLVLPIVTIWSIFKAYEWIASANK